MEDDTYRNFAFLSEEMANADQVKMEMKQEQVWRPEPLQK